MGVDKDTLYLNSAETQFLAPDQEEISEIKITPDTWAQFRADIVWVNVGLFTILHTGAVLGLYQLIFHAKWMSCAWVIGYSIIAGQGVTAGAHRLWTHKSYKATRFMRVLLMFCNCGAFQNDIIDWSRDHRCHHKWNDSKADPYNSERGFFFSHMGWLCMRKHPEVKRKGATLDMSDLLHDDVLLFQRKYYLLLVPIFCFLLPAAVPIYFWNETMFIGLVTCAMYRYCFTLHFTWLINSAAHKWGTKPYDDEISAVDSKTLAAFTLGEGGHNFHHVFPQDYRTSEYDYLHNMSKVFIDIFAKLGCAFDRKVVSQQVIERQKAKCHRKLG